jgi:pantoate kinase
MIAYFREKAEQCRRMAANITGDPTAEALLRLAEEFEAKAALYEAQKRAARAIGEMGPKQKDPRTRNIQ